MNGLHTIFVQIPVTCTKRTREWANKFDEVIFHVESYFMITLTLHLHATICSPDKGVMLSKILINNYFNLSCLSCVCLSCMDGRGYDNILSCWNPMEARSIAKQNKYIYLYVQIHHASNTFTYHFGFFHSWVRPDSDNIDCYHTHRYNLWLIQCNILLHFDTD